MFRSGYEHDLAPVRRIGQAGRLRRGLLILLAMLALLVIGHGRVVAEDGGLCAECHHDQERLKELSQRWSRVYVDPDQYYGEKHSALGCTTCHAGDPTQDDPELACIGVAYKDPAARETVGETCGACHVDITSRHLNSLHSTMDGHLLALEDLLGAGMINDRQYQSCTKCHATCSDCHVKEQGAHGLLYPRVESHYFAPRPPVENCRACHGGTGDTFFGEPGNEDAHGPSMMAQAGMVCMDCHSEKEVHGDGNRYPFLVYSPKPHCHDCHEDSGRQVRVGDGLTVAPQYETGNAAHAIHSDDVISCEACHTEWYASCWNCHSGRVTEVRYEHYLAINPLTNKVHPAAHSPAAGEDWGDAIPVEIGGGWAIKSRHSWGRPQSCETCHVDASTYIDEEGRRAPFIGYWVAERGNATFVDTEWVQSLLIDIEALESGVHAEIGCAGCHSVLDDSTCRDCHATLEDSSAPVEGSRTSYLAANACLESTKRLMEMAAEMGVETPSWQAAWSELRSRYLWAGNYFHQEPVAAQTTMEALAQECEQQRTALHDAVSTQETRRQMTVAGAPLALGLLGALTLGFVAYRSIRREE